MLHNDCASTRQTTKAKQQSVSVIFSININENKFIRLPASKVSAKQQLQRRQQKQTAERTQPDQTSTARLDNNINAISYANVFTEMIL